jgi:phosphopantetheinyl transferase
MRNTFIPKIYVARGDEKTLSRALRMYALEKTLYVPFKIYTDSRGKPYVDSEVAAAISITHDENVVCVLVAPVQDAGIDIMKNKDEYPTKVADRFFSPAEKRELKRKNNFFEIWCRKESWVKMTGEGISGLSTLDTRSKDPEFRNLSSEISELLQEPFTLFTCTLPPIRKPEIVLVNSEDIL